MQTRRNFIKIASGAAALGLSGLAIPKLSLAFAGETIPDPGVQLFTFFNALDNDVPGTLKKISEIGVKNIESAFSRKGDYYGLPAKTFSNMLKDLGMKWRSHHAMGAPIKMPVKNLAENAQEIIDQVAEGGVEFLVAAHLPIGSAKEISTSLDIINKSSVAAQKAGIQLIYHNETADFEEVDGKIPYEVFLRETDPNALKFELDIAWAIKAGQDPLTLFGRYPGRFPLWHIKDLDNDYNNVLPVGQGVLNYGKYFQSAKTAGLRYYFIEHENASDPIDSVATSIAAIKKMA